MSANELVMDGVIDTPATVPDAQAEAWRQYNDKLNSMDGVAPRLTQLCRWRFFNINNFNVDTAAKAVEDYLKWRVEINADNFPNSEQAELIRKILPYQYIGEDKEFRPLYFEKTGMMQCSLAAALLKEKPFVDSHIYGLEILSKRMAELSKQQGRVVDTLTAVFDLTGLGLGHRNVIWFLQACMALDVKYYPNRVGKILVVNAPWVAKVIWPTVQVFLDATTQSRIELLSDPSELLKHIDAQYVPKEYGGEGPDVEVMDVSDLAGSEQKDDGLDKQNVAAGSQWTKKLSTTDNSAQTFTWFFESEGGYDVDFSVVAKSASGESTVVPVGRVVSHKGEYSVKEPTELTFIWDNTYSWMTSKDIKLSITVNPTIELGAKSS